MARMAIARAAKTRDRPVSIHNIYSEHLRQRETICLLPVVGEAGQVIYAIDIYNYPSHVVWAVFHVFPLQVAGNTRMENVFLVIHDLGTTNSKCFRDYICS